MTDFKLTPARRRALSAMCTDDLVAPGRGYNQFIQMVDQRILDAMAEAGLAWNTGAMVTVNLFPPTISRGWTLTAAGRALASEALPSRAAAGWWTDPERLAAFEEFTGQPLNEEVTG
jgi:hypothetical protein